MRILLTRSIIALGMGVAAPVMAQGVYVGPGGVGVDTGIHPYGYHHRHYRDYDRDGYRGDRARESYEGRSAYPDHYHDAR